MRYDDVLSSNRRRPSLREAPAELGEVLEDGPGGFCGAIVAADNASVTLEDRDGARRVFPLRHPGFLIDGEPVRLVRAPVAASGAPRRSASGSTAVAGLRARTARASRILVEGIHDAELVERIWGHDLRVEGVVVECLHGADRLEEVVAEFEPGPHRRLGVLLDHLVPGSKESRIAERVSGEHVLVCGHPFVDVWQAVKPARLGIDAWPTPTRDVEWKQGVLDALGWKLSPGEAWRKILAKVNGFADLEPELLGRVEELIDFVSPPH